MNTETLPTARHLGGPFRGLGPVFTWGLRHTFTRKRAWLGLILSAGAGALIGATSSEGTNDPLFALWKDIDEVLLRVVAPVIALLMVAQGFAAEVRGGTLLYHLVRPVPRHVVFLGRFASGWVAGLVAACALTAGTAVTATTIPTELWLKLLVVLVFTVTALGALYYTLATLLRRGLIAGLVYTFLIEVLLGTMPGAIQKAAVNHHARGMFHGWCDDWFQTNSPRVASELAGGTGNPLQAVFEEVSYDSPMTAMTVLLCIAVACLLIGVWRIRQRDFPLKD